MKHSKKILSFGLAASLMAVPCAQALEMPKFSDVPENTFGRRSTSTKWRSAR